jgi:glycosyltransferase involved in cell wall biosynthesis
MIKIGIDARFITRFPRRGIGNYSLSLIQEIVKLPGNHKFFIYICDKDIDGVLPSGDNIVIRRIYIPIYPLWENLILPIFLLIDGINILHSLGNTSPVYVPKKIKKVVTIHDVMFLKNDLNFSIKLGFYRFIARLYQKCLISLSIKSVNKIITVSEYSKNDILSTVKVVKESDICVTYQSCDIRFKNNAINSMPNIVESKINPYILLLGADDPRKNTYRAIKAFIETNLYSSNGLNLIVCGYSGWEKSESYHLVCNSDAKPFVKFIDFISTDNLVSLYKNAEFFIYPSTYEGFGIPLLEAFSTGCPVIASKVTSIPEVAGDAALLFDPYNVAEIRDSIIVVAKDNLLRATLAQKGLTRSELFTWIGTAKATLNVYHDLLFRG